MRHTNLPQDRHLRALQDLQGKESNEERLMCGPYPWAQGEKGLVEQGKALAVL